MKKLFSKNNIIKINLIALLFIFVFIGCSKDDSVVEPQINESEVLLKYLEENGDFINTAAPTMITAEDIKTQLSVDATKIHIIDIRPATDFANGHIEGAVNIELAKLRQHFQSINPASYTKIAIVCFSGQTASYAASLMRLLGYNNVFALKWGMASWHSNFRETWTKKLSNARATQFVKDETPKGPEGPLPTINTGKKTAKEILEARVDDLLAKGYTEATITPDEVFSKLNTFYIVNYWPKDQYLDPGHIPGAMQYTPKADLKSTTFLKTLPANKTVILYCYTGQTSSFLAAYLRLLGYDAKSILFGANSMIYDLMKAKDKGFTYWKDTECKDYDFKK
jgi:rhodanese-related sulfurtransferase